MNLNQIDFNLLTVLKQLLAEKHVSNTALTLGMSQPSVSRILQKFRRLFNDPLLVRTHNTYQLTPKAEYIQHELSELLLHMERMMAGQEFEPKTCTKTIKLFGLAPQMEIMASNIIKRIHQHAPNIQIDIDTIPKPHFTGLINGEVHFVISVLAPPSSEQSLYKAALFDEDFRFIMAKNHPLADQNLSVEKLRQYSFGQVSIQGDQQLSIASRFRRLGIDDLHVPIKLNDISLAASIAESSEVLFHLPTSYVEKILNKFEILAREVPDPIKMPLSMNVNLYWHRRYHYDPVCTWVREQIRSVANECSEQGMNGENLCG